MTIDPRSEQDIVTQLQGALSGKIAKLTNFVPSSFNKVWINAYANELSEAEIKLLVAQLSGWVDYAGKDDLDKTDLERLGLDTSSISPSDINPRMDDSQLENLAPIVGVTRDPGQKATGQVTVFTATDNTRVPEGMEVATQPDVDGNYKSYFVDADSDGEIGNSGYVTPSAGSTKVTVDIISEDVGSEYNVGAGTISMLPNPPVGVEGVTNNAEVTGGKSQQSLESLRNDIKNAVFENSGGGTASGIIGYIEENVNNVSDVEIDEFYNQQPPYVDVIVDGGSDSDIISGIENSRPTGIEHNLVRPQVVSVGVSADMSGTDIDESFVRSEISDYLTELGIDSEYRRAKLAQRILNADSDIVDLGSFTGLILDIINESKIYQSGTSIYKLNYAPLGVVNNEELMYDSGQGVYNLLYEGMNSADVQVIASVNGTDVTLTEGTDYNVIDNDGDGLNDSIDFGIGGANPDNRSTVKIEYNHSSWTISSTITDENGNTYNKGTDWDLIDNNSDGYMDSIDWSIGGSSPNGGVRWTIDYNPKKTISRDLPVSKREKIGDAGRIEIDIYSPENIN